MDRNSTKRLRLDQRLIRRRGWISSDELERELAALPDAASKATALEESAPAGGEPASPAPEGPA